MDGIYIKHSPYGDQRMLGNREQIFDSKWHRIYFSLRGLGRYSLGTSESATQWLLFSHPVKTAGRAGKTSTLDSPGRRPLQQQSCCPLVRLVSACYSRCLCHRRTNGSGGLHRRVGVGPRVPRNPRGTLITMVHLRPPTNATVVSFSSPL